MVQLEMQLKSITMDKKKMLAKGIKLMASCLPFMFLGPVILQYGFEFRNYLTITCGVLMMGLAVFLLFKGLITVVNAFFSSE